MNYGIAEHFTLYYNYYNSTYSGGSTVLRYDSRLKGSGTQFPPIPQ